MQFFARVSKDVRAAVDEKWIIIRDSFCKLGDNRDLVFDFRNWIFK